MLPCSRRHWQLWIMVECGLHRAWPSFPGTSWCTYLTCMGKRGVPWGHQFPIHKAADFAGVESIVHISHGHHVPLGNKKKNKLWKSQKALLLLLLFWKNYLCTRLVSTFWGWNSNLTRWRWILLSFFPAFTVHSRTSIGPEKWAEYPRPFPVRKLCRNSKQDQTCISQWVCIQVRPGTLFQG